MTKDNDTLTVAADAARNLNPPTPAKPLSPVFRRPDRPTWVELQKAMEDGRADKAMFRACLKAFKAAERDALRNRDAESEKTLGEAIAACEKALGEGA